MFSLSRQLLARTDKSQVGQRHVQFRFQLSFGRTGTPTGRRENTRPKFAVLNEGVEVLAKNLG